LKPAPVKAKGAVKFLGREDTVVGTIQDLEGVRGEDGAIYSCWEPDWIEKIKLLFGRPLVIGVMSTKQPPICVKVGRDKIAVASESLAVSYTLLDRMLNKIEKRRGLA
jgi:hypothetical protein